MSKASRQPLIHMIDPRIGDALPLHLAERTRSVASGHSLTKAVPQTSGEYVLYWSHHALRAHENPALDAAVHLSNTFEKPLLVYQGLGGQHRFNSDRHHAFILQGARDFAAQLATRNITFAFSLNPKPRDHSPLAQLIDRASIVITEDFPAPPFSGWISALSNRSQTPIWLVDTACIVPMRMLPMQYDRAFSFRAAALAEFQSRVTRPWTEAKLTAPPFAGELGFIPIDLQTAKLDELIADCKIDHSVPPVLHTQGGTTAGYARWETFKEVGLNRYADLRNDAAIAPPLGTSRMSSYLHYGMVSPIKIAREAAAINSAGAIKFLDELFVWRELAHNFCLHSADPESWEALPAWAQMTLEQHAGDRRDVLYSLEQLSRAQTHDALWNAAQRSLLIHGELHNNLRMTWGKMLLRWTRSPQQALDYLIELNHRFALDGNDPNSYGGLLWCLGLFDRPFSPEVSIYGTVRPRDSMTHQRRLDMKEYSKRIDEPSSGQKLSVAVVGAGLAGLTAARLLVDQGHEVVCFDKSRGVGGRMSVRRQDGFEFDHGAQYFTARDPQLRKQVESWIQQGVVSEWTGKMVNLTRGEISPRDSQQRYIGLPGMTGLAKHLATNLNIQLSKQISQLRFENQKWNLLTEDGTSLGLFDRLILTVPVVQARALLSAHPELLARISEAQMQPCWAVMAGFDERIETEFDGAFVHESPLSWIARNNSKPGRSQQEAWVLHGSPEWSMAHLEEPAESIAAQLLAEFQLQTRSTISPKILQAHRWRYARAEPAMHAGAVWDEQLQIAVCGDWCAGNRVEGAYLSGIAAAGKLLGSLS